MIHYIGQGYIQDYLKVFLQLEIHVLDDQQATHNK